MNTIYEDYARSVGLTYISLQVLNLIAQIEECTQKIICDKTLIPKQTVNTIVINFLKKDLVVLKEYPSNRRIKTIHFTDKGVRFVSSIIPKIRQAECQAIGNLTQVEQQIFLQSLEKYCKSFKESLAVKQNIESENNDKKIQKG